MVGIVEKVGSDVHKVKPGDRVAVNVETFCGECFFCRHGYVNNCTDPDGGWALGCRIDGGQAALVRVPHADQGLSLIPDNVSDRQALFTGDILATGFWASRISGITEEDTVLIIGAGPTGVCTLLCAMLKRPERIIICEKDPARSYFIRKHYPDVLVTGPDTCKEFVMEHSRHGGADVVLEVAGTEETFRLAWECARPNAIVTIVAMYDRPQTLPLPDMYGKNLMDCHNDRSKAIIRQLLETGGQNVYTIEKDGIRKMIYQSAWKENGKVMGLCEISIVLPGEIPHYVRK